MGTNKITGTGDPTSAQDVATKNYIDTLFGSTTSAASSASAAATSATASASSATASASSATASASSATAAAASYDSFDDRYLGAKSSAPTVDNDGDALVVGALFFDTTANSMKVYSSGGWVAAGSSVNGTSARYDYVVGTNSGSYTDSSTTTFPATYDAGYADIYLNGVKLVVGTDVTASSGTNVVLSSAAATGDNICIVGYGTFNLASFSVGEANDVDLTGNANNAILAFDTTDSRFEPTLTPTLTSLTTTGNVDVGGNITVTGSTTLNGALTLGDAAADSLSINATTTVNENMTFTDNDKAIFGTGGDLEIYHDASDSYIKDVGTGNLLIQGSDIYMGNTSSNHALVIRNSGNVGIGSTSAPELLTLKASSTEETMLLFEDNSATDIGSISIHPSNGFVIQQKVAGASVHLMTHDGNEDINLDSDGFIQFEAAGSEAMRIHNGNVSIGNTTADNGILSITANKGSAGSLWSQVGPNNNASLIIQNSSATDNTNAVLYFANDAGVSAAINARFTDHSNDTTELRFSTHNGTAGAERMVLDGDGKLGLGTMSPSAILEIVDSAAGAPGTALKVYSAQNSAAADGLVFIHSDQSLAPFTALNVRQDGTGDVLNLLAETTEVMNVDANGDVILGGTDAAYNVLTVGRTGTGGQGQGIINIKSQGASKLNFFDVATNTISLFSHSVNLRIKDVPNGDDSIQFGADGNLDADGSYRSNGVDYAEYFESTDGTAIPVGTSVVLVNEKVRAATSGEQPLGVVRPGSEGTSVVGGSAGLRWTGKYLKDDYDGYLYDTVDFWTWKDVGDTNNTGDEDQHCWSDRVPAGWVVPSDKTVTPMQRKRLNPEFIENLDADGNQIYANRESRDEWNCIGLLGQVPITKGQAINSNWTKLKDRSETVELWFIK
jgi:hypothetical protein